MTLEPPKVIQHMFLMVVHIRHDQQLNCPQLEEWQAAIAGLAVRQSRLRMLCIPLLTEQDALHCHPHPRPNGHDILVDTWYHISQANSSDISKYLLRKAMFKSTTKSRMWDDVTSSAGSGRSPGTTQVRPTRPLGGRNKGLVGQAATLKMCPDETPSGDSLGLLPLRDSLHRQHFTPPSLCHFIPRYIATGLAGKGP